MYQAIHKEVGLSFPRSFEIQHIKKPFIVSTRCFIACTEEQYHTAQGGKCLTNLGYKPEF